MSFESFVIVLVVGLLAGWLAGFVMKGGGYGLTGDIALGLVGGIVGSFLLRTLGFAPAGSRVAAVGVAFIGAVVLIAAQRTFWGVAR
jgi:uncharacterized membrane protein YeaQ/YmgE (transglycosylase-associated protein family)